MHLHALPIVHIYIYILYGIKIVPIGPYRPLSAPIGPYRPLSAPIGPYRPLRSLASQSQEAIVRRNYVPEDVISQIYKMYANNMRGHMRIVCN